MSAAPTSEPLSTPQDWLRAAAGMTDAIRERDWSATSLGPRDNWPESLRSLTRLMLASAQPMFIAWGPQATWLYNDAFVPILGTKHPTALGLPALTEVWREADAVLAPLFAQVFAGHSVQMDDFALDLDRDGTLREAHFSFSYTPARDEAGDVRGLFGVCTETTRHVIGERRLAQVTARQRQQFEQAPGFIIVTSGPEHTVDFVNEAHRRMFGSQDWVGRTIREAFPSLEGQGLFEQLDGVFSTGEPFEAAGSEVRYRRGPDAPEEQHFLSFVYAPIFDEHGHVEGVFCEGFDVTAQHRAQTVLTQREEQLRLAIEAAEVGLWDVDQVNGTLFWPPRVKAMFGISPEVPVTMADFYQGLHPEDRERTSLAFAAAVDPVSRDLYDVEYRTVGKEDGVIRWVAAKGRGVFNDDGVCTRVIGTAIDVSARKHAEEHLRLMVNELNHRVKNSLATVQAIVTQTLRSASVTPVIREALTGRILALAKAHDVLTETRWTGANLQEIAEQAAGPYRHLGPGFEIKGPPVVLPPRTAIAMALAFHELATNAAKYGALSSERGQVSLTWTAEPSPAGGVLLEVEWRECGGPAVVAPQTTGFGTRLIERSLSADLGGQARLSFEAEGLVCRIEALVHDEPTETVAGVTWPAGG